MMKDRKVKEILSRVGTSGGGRETERVNIVDVLCIHV
jgi:hypothetical protein